MILGETSGLGELTLLEPLERVQYAIELAPLGLQLSVKRQQDLRTSSGPSLADQVDSLELVFLLNGFQRVEQLHLGRAGRTAQPTQDVRKLGSRLEHGVHVALFACEHECAALSDLALELRADLLGVNELLHILVDDRVLVRADATKREERYHRHHRRQGHERDDETAAGS